MNMNMATSLSLLLSLFLLSPTINAFDITQILSPYPDFSSFNRYLTQTNLSADINSRQTVTVLVVDNAAISAVSSKPLDLLKNILSVHVILDYFDTIRLQQLSANSALVTTLLQASGSARGQQGFLNVTRVDDGGIAFGSAMPGSPLTSSFVRSVTSQAYNVSVVQASGLIVPQGIDGSKICSPKSRALLAAADAAAPVSSVNGTATPPSSSSSVNGTATPPPPSPVSGATPPPPSTVSGATPPPPSPVAGATPPPPSTVAGATPPPPSPASGATPPPPSSVNGIATPPPSSSAPATAPTQATAGTVPTTAPTTSSSAPVPSTAAPTAATPTMTATAATPSTSPASGPSSTTATDTPAEEEPAAAGETPAEENPKAKSAGTSLAVGVAGAFTMVLSTIFIASAV